MNSFNKKAFSSRHFLMAGLLSATVLTPEASLSATQGIAGATSSASMTITLTIPPKLIAETTSEIPINAFSFSGINSSNRAAPLCVKSSGLSNYTLTASGHTDNEGFVLQNGNGWRPYEVTVNHASDEEILLVAGQPSSEIPALKRNEDCDDASTELALNLQEPLDETETIVGVMNLTINAE